MLETLLAALPALHDSLTEQPAIAYTDPLWDHLRRLLVAHAPSGGANLLGGIGDDIAVLAETLGLRDRAIPHLGSTGNTAIWLGADKAAPDVVVVAHMDRPSFRVGDVDSGALVPICAIRFPAGEYRATAKAVRFERGRLVVRAEGVLIAAPASDQDAGTLRFETRRGQLAWHDTVLMDANPVRDGDRVVGTGLDNSAGVITALLAAAALRGVESVLYERDRRCLFVFTDQEEGDPAGFFGHGAARLAGAIPPPTYGGVVVDAHNAGADASTSIAPGGGASHGTVSNRGRGSIVPPNYHALAMDLGAALNAARPGTVQMNTGYLSRSDDMALGRWTRVLGLIGPPLEHAHTAQESVHLGDIQAGVWWLTHFLAATLNLAPDLTPRYALGR